jgi:hypothetical protein
LFDRLATVPTGATAARLELKGKHDPERVRVIEIGTATPG